MILNFYVLKRWVNETAPQLSGAKTVEIFSQRKDVLMLGYVTAERLHEALEIDLRTQRGHVVRRSTYHRQRKNLADLFGEAVGQKVRSMNMDSADRVIRFELQSQSIVIELFGGGNVFLVDSTGRIVDAFKDARDLLGTTYTSSSGRLQAVSLQSFEEFRKHVPDASSLKTLIGGGGLHLSKPLVQEILFHWHSDNIREGYSVVCELVERMANENPVLYLKDNEPVLLAPCRLTGVEARNPGWQMIRLETMNDAIEKYLAEKDAYERGRKTISDVLKVCRARIKKNMALLSELQNDLKSAQTHRKQEEVARLAGANIYKMKTGMDSIRVIDYGSPNQDEITIRLKPTLSPSENVESLFARAKKLKASVQKIEARIVLVEKEKTYLDTCARLAEEATDVREVERIHKEFTKHGWIQRPEKEKKNPKVEYRFREYRVAGNWRVFVGQNDAKNDQLTFRFARGDDYWFHARSVSGSHVVLKRDGRKDNPGKAALEEAASIAAFFSKARTSSMVPVAWTLRKFVRKRKGAPPGQVVLEREEVLMVQPVKPEKNSGEDPSEA